MFERDHDILCVCCDNEGYMNTGYQRSGLISLGARTTTSSPGRLSYGNRTCKKNMPVIALAMASPTRPPPPYPSRGTSRKVQRALEIEGPKYLHILVPCVPVWGYESELTAELARLEVEPMLFPLLEIEDGVITKV